MSSKRHSEEKALELRLPTSPQDVEALRRARSSGSLSLAEALARLSRVEHLPSAEGPSSKKRRDTSEGWIAFSLE